MRSLDQELLSVLLGGQRASLKRLKISSEDMHYTELPAKIQVLDLWLSERRYLTSDAKKLVNLGGNCRLRELYLTTASGTSKFYTTSLKGLFEGPKPKWMEEKTLRVLSLQGFVLADIFQQLEQGIRFQGLTRLVLWNCASLHVFLAEVVRWNAQQELSLEHLAVTIQTDSETYIESPLGSILDLCPRLLSFCTRWNSEGGYQPTALIGNIVKRGAPLRMLSLHDGRLRGDGDTFWLNLRKIYENCPKLQQVGCRYPEPAIAKMISGEGTNVEQLANSICVSCTASASSIAFNIS